MNRRRHSLWNLHNRNTETIFYQNEKLILLFVFLGALNFMDKYSYMIYAAFAVFLFSRRSKIKIDISLIFLFILSISLLIFSPSSEHRFTNMIRPFTYPICYIMGCNMLDCRTKSLRSCEKSMFGILVLCAAATLLHYVLNMLINLDNVLWGSYTDFWTRAEMSTTGQAVLACIPIAIICSVLFLNVKAVYKIIAGALLVMILYYNFILAGRTIIIQTVVIVAISVIYIVLNSRTDTKKKIGYTFATILLFLLIYIAYNSDFFNIKTTIESSNFYARFFSEKSMQGIGDDRRIELKLMHMSHLLDYPFGGEHIRGLVGNYAHDLYLDTYDNSGVFALVGVTGYSATSIYILTKILSSKKLAYNTQHIVLCTYLAMHIEFSIEPILIGSPWFFALFCFINGAVVSLAEA